MTESDRKEYEAWASRPDIVARNETIVRKWLADLIADKGLPPIIAAEIADAHGIRHTIVVDGRRRVEAGRRYERWLKRHHPQCRRGARVLLATDVLLLTGTPEHQEKQARQLRGACNWRFRPADMTGDWV